MNITKEKKKAAPKGMKLPSKTYINLAQKESRKKDVVASVLGLVLILIVIRRPQGLFGKLKF